MRLRKRNSVENFLVYLHISELMLNKTKLSLLRIKISNTTIMKRKVTLKQIAKNLMFPFQQYLNLSEKQNRRETRLKVQAFAKFYHYRPNNIAPFKTENKKSLYRKLCIIFSLLLLMEWNRLPMKRLQNYLFIRRFL
jgi:hypothetical protein